MRTITSSRAEILPIGELSKRSGVKIETIRYYERVKMLPAPPRSASGRRVYGTMDLASSRLSVARANLGFRSMTSARCSGLEDRQKARAAKYETSPPITSKTFAPSSTI